MIDLLGELEGLQCHSTTGTLSDSSKNVTIINCLFIIQRYVHGNHISVFCQQLLLGMQAKYHAQS